MFYLLFYLDKLVQNMIISYLDIVQNMKIINGLLVLATFLILVPPWNVFGGNVALYELFSYTFIFPDVQCS